MTVNELQRGDRKIKRDERLQGMNLTIRNKGKCGVLYFIFIILTIYNYSIFETKTNQHARTKVLFAS